MFRKEFPEADLDPVLDLDGAALDWSNFPAQLFQRRQLPEREKSLLGVLYRKCHYIRKNGQPGYWNNQRPWREYDSRTPDIGVFENVRFFFKLPPQRA